jgi:uncharacterized protein
LIDWNRPSGKKAEGHSRNFRLAGRIIVTLSETIKDFMAQKRLVLVRASRKSPVSGFRIDQELGAKGYTMSVVYLDEVGPGVPLADPKDNVCGAIIAVPAAECERAVTLAAEVKIPRIWIQKGCESDPAIRRCQENSIPVVHGECIMMHAEPVKSFHAFHRWLWKTLGKFPK